MSRTYRDYQKNNFDNVNGFLELEHRFLRMTTIKVYYRQNSESIRYENINPTIRWPSPSLVLESKFISFKNFSLNQVFLYPIHRRNANTEVYRWPKELDCYYCWLLFELVFSCKRKGKKSNFNEKLTQKRTFALSMFDCDCFLVKFLVDFHDFDFVAEKVRLVHRNET